MKVRLVLSLGLAPTRPLTQLGGNGIEEHVERRDLAVANDDHIHAGVFGRFAAWAGAPGQTAGIVESLRFAVRRVRKVRVGRTEITSKFVEGFTPNKRAGRHIEHTVFGIELVDRCAATHRVALAEDLLKVALKQFVDTVIHNISPWLLTVAMLPLGSITEEQYDDTFGRNVNRVLFTVQKAPPLLVDGASVILTASNVSI